MIILSRQGDTKEKFINHAKSHKWWEADTKGLTNAQVFRELRNRPVCPKCESMAMRHKDRNNAKCPKCGWEGKTISLDQMITQQLYK